MVFIIINTCKCFLSPYNIEIYKLFIPNCIAAANIVAPCSQVLITNREYRRSREWTISRLPFSIYRKPGGL